MNFRFTAIAASLFLAGSALAQVQPQRPAPVHVQPGVPAASAAAQPPANSAEAPVQVDPAKEKAIRHLMDITGEAKLGPDMTEVLSMQVKNTMSRRLAADRLQKFMDDFNQKLNAKNPATEIEDAQVPIYAQHFSLEELQGMIQFYETPAGQKMAKQLPDVLQQSRMAGATIERKAALDTLKDMTTEYPELKALLPQDESNPGAGSKPPGSLKPKQPQPQQPPKPQSPQR